MQIRRDAVDNSSVGLAGKPSCRPAVFVQAEKGDSQIPRLQATHASCVVSLWRVAQKPLSLLPPGKGATGHMADRPGF